MNRIYLSADDVAQALINAGFDIRPEDCLRTKYGDVAEELSDKMRKETRRELDEFTRKLTRPSKA